jgi:glutaredoxin
MVMIEILVIFSMGVIILHLRFCPDCVHVDKKLEQKVKESTKKKIDKASESIKVIENGRDWGKGLGTAAVSDKFCVVPKDHLGKIPGVPSGRLWASRVDASSLKLFNIRYSKIILI